MADDHAHHQGLSYADAVTAFRADKDRFFGTSQGSPIPRSPCLLTPAEKAGMGDRPDVPASPAGPGRGGRAAGPRRIESPVATVAAMRWLIAAQLLTWWSLG